MPKSTRMTTSRTADYSIPRKFVVIIQPNTAPPQPQPPVIGHCLLCLRRLREPTGIQNLKIGESLDDLPIVPKAVLCEGDLLPTFNKLLPFIHRKWTSKNKKKSRDPLDLLNKNVPQYKHQAPDSGALPKNFPHLPAMCSMCGEQLEEINGLMDKLRGRIEEMKRTIKMSKMPEGRFGWRQLQFEDDLRNNMDLEEVSRRRTMEFLEGFGEAEDEEEMVEATVGGGGDAGGGNEEEDPLACDEEEGEGEEEEDFEVKIEVGEETEEDPFENEVDDEEKSEEEEWSASPEVKQEPESGPSYQSSKRCRRTATGPASKTGRYSKPWKPSEIISDSFEEEGGPGPRRSSRNTTDKSRTLSLSSSPSSSAVKDPGSKKFFN